MPIPTLEQVEESGGNMDTITEFIKSGSPSLVDQYGETRKTLTGAEEDITTAIIGAGYQIVGDFADVTKFEITSDNQVYTSKSIVGFEDALWRTNQVLPYTATGSDPAQAPEKDKWLAVAVGELKTVAIALNKPFNAVEYGKPGVTITATTEFLRNPDDQTTYSIPAGVGDGEVIVSVVGDQLSTDVLTYTLDRVSFTRNFDTLQSALDSASAMLGDVAQVKERNEGQGGGAIWDYVVGGTYTVGPTIFDVFDHATLPLQLKMRLDKNTTPEMFGCAGPLDTTANLDAYQVFISNSKGVYKEPISALNTVNLIGPSILASERRRVNSTGIATLRKLFVNPERGLHFIGDSVANGFSAGIRIPGNARESYSWPNLLGYGLRRNKSNLALHDKTLCTELAAGSLHGTLTAPLGAMIDYTGMLDESVIAGSGGAAINFCALGQPIKFQLPKGGKASIYAMSLDGFAPVVAVTISINGSATLPVVPGDKFAIEGFTNPNVLDLSVAKAQHRILEITYDETSDVVVTFESTTSEKLFFLTGVTRTDTAFIYMPTTNLISKNASDVYGPARKVVARSSVGRYNTTTIAYLADAAGADVTIKFLMDDNSIVPPSSIAGIAMHDTLGGGAIVDKDTMVTDSTQAGSSGVQRYITRSYFMIDKSDLSEQGVVGVIMYNTISNITIHDVSFHGIVNNEGVSGATTLSYITNEMTRITPYAKQGDVIVIAIGINDWVLQEAGSYSTEKKNLRSLAKLSLLTGAQVVMMTNTQVRFSTTAEAEKDNRNLRFQDIQQAIVDVANEFGCPVIDWNAYNQEFTDWNSTSMDDNLHPNRRGHLSVANGMLNMLGLVEYESN